MWSDRPRRGSRFRRIMGDAQALALRARRMVARTVDSCRGAVAIEFALGFPIFLALIYALFEFARVFWVQHTLDNAVSEAARFVMINPSASNATIEDIVIQNATGLDSVLLSTEASVSNGVAEVTTTYQFNLFVPFVALEDWTLSATYSVTTVQ